MSETNREIIINDSYYLINLFDSSQNIITQLMVQKLMYFFEAYYMNKKEVKELYDCPFKAWTFGPVAIPLYDKYKKFGSNKIILLPEEKEIGNSIAEDKKEILKEIYEFFGGYTAMQLVNLTHMENSPWHKKWMENKCRITYGDESNIDKQETKKWFKEKFISE